MDYKARLTLDTSQHDDAIKKSAKQVGEYDSKVKQTGTDVRKLIAEERKAARERAIANKHYQDMARSVGDFSKGLTGGIGVLGKFSGALAIGATAAKVMSDAFMASESNIDAWGVAMEQAKGAYEVFVSTLNTGNWTNFFENLKEALKGSKELYEIFDKFGSLTIGNAPAIATRQAELAELKRLKQEGKKYTSDGKKVNDEIKRLGKEIYDLQIETAEAGKAAGLKGITEKIKNYKGASAAAAEEAARGYFESGYTAAISAATAEIAELEKKAGTKTIYHIQGYNMFGGSKTTPEEVIAEENLTEAERDRYRALQGLIQEETRSSAYTAQYTTSISQAKAAEDEYRGTIKFAEREIKKGGDDGKDLNQEVVKLTEAIKRYRARMSALRSWSGVTNMSEIEVLESSVKYTSELINEYYKKLEQLKETEGETATLSEEENKQLNKLIDAQKDYEKKLKLERKKWEPARQLRNVGNDSGLQTRAEALNSTYNKYIQSINANELIRVFRNGEIHTNIREDAFSSQDSRRQDQMVSIVNYLKNIRGDAQLLINDIEYQSKHLAKVNNGAALYREDINHMKPGEHFTEAHYKQIMERLGARDYDEETRTYNTNTPESEVYGRFVQMAWKACASEQVSKEIISKLSGELTDAFVGSIDDAILRGDYSQIADQLEFAMKAKDFGFSDEQISKMVEHLSDAIEYELNSIHWEGYEIGKGQISNAQNATDTLVGLADAWKNLEETMSSNDTSGWEQFTALVSTIQTTIDSFFQLIDVFRQFGELEKSWDLLNERRIAVTQQQTQANMVQATSEQAKAQAAVESSTQAAVATQTLGATIIATNKAIEASSITEMAAKIVAAYGALPAGPALAAARIAEMLAIYKTASVGSFSQGGIVPKFADGGIFSANRSVGDYNIARVNSGEMLLNGSQQAKLFQLLDGTGGFTNNQPSGEVTFRIQGDTLIGVLNNYNKKRSKII